MSLIGLAGVYALMTCASVGVSDGLLVLAHDPGKNLFHFVLLPAAAYLFVLSVPIAALRDGFKKSRPAALFSVVVAVAFAIVITWLVYSDGVSRFGGSNESPPQLRLPQSVLAELTDEYLWPFSPESRGAPTGTPPPSAPGPSAETSAAGSAMNNGEESSTPEEPGGPRDAGPSARYREAVLAAVGHDRLDFARDASVRAYLGVLLSWIGAMTVGAYIWMLVSFMAMRPPVSRQAAEAGVLIFALFSAWIPLHAYSEWFNSFGQATAADLQLLIVGGTASIATALMWFVVRTPRRKVLTAGGLSAALALVGGFVAYFNIEAFHAAAGAFAQLSPSSLAVIYTVVIVAVIAILAWLIAEPNQQDPSRDAAAP